jgi:thiol:disulfide interchange protein DsbD
MKRLILIALLAFIGSRAHAQFGAGGRDFASAVPRAEAKIAPTTARRGETVTWSFTVELSPGWHAYPTQQPDPAADSFITKIKPPKTGDLIFVGTPIDQPNPLKRPEPDLKVKELRYYENTATWELKAVVSPNATPGPKTVEVTIQPPICDEVGCLPPSPIKKPVTLLVSDAPPVPVDPKFADAVQAALGGNAPSPKTSDKAPPSRNGASASPPTVTSDYGADLSRLQLNKTGAGASITPANTGLMPFLLTAALWGLVSVVTPCVFPMIPITVSFFLKQSEKKQFNPLTQALVYCGTIVLVLGVAALTLLSVFRELSVRPWTNIALAILFVILGLSLLGMFELTLPSALTRFTSSREGRGGLVGTIFMALTFTIVSFTCVAPFLGGFAGIAASGQFRWYEMLLGAFAFSAAFAAPFFLLALFPSALRSLPRSGSWLNTVKVVMGFLELAAALKFFRTAELRLLAVPEFFTYDLVLGLWVALSVVCGLYLLNIIRLPHDEPQEAVGVGRMLSGFLFLGLGFYLLPGLFKSGPESERQRPSGAVFAWIDAFLLPEPTQSPGDLAWGVNLPQAIAKAREERAKNNQRQFIFVDFTGVTCTNCKYNERNIFTKPEVRDLFKQFSRLVQMYTDEVPVKFYTSTPGDGQRELEAAANLAFQKQQFRTEQLPLYVILEPLPDGEVAVVGVYQEGKINNVEAFADFLRKPFQGEMVARAAGGQ